jgi:hypothetical protein
MPRRTGFFNREKRGWRLDGWPRVLSPLVDLHTHTYIYILCVACRWIYIYIHREREILWHVGVIDHRSKEESRDSASSINHTYTRVMRVGILNSLVDTLTRPDLLKPCIRCVKWYRCNIIIVIYSAIIDVSRIYSY